MAEARIPVTVSALNKYVRSLLESDRNLADIRLRGEVSNFIHHRSGHCYFTLKDQNSSVKAVMFSGDARYLQFAPQNGMQVVVDCRVSLFERDGSFQIYVQHMFPDGLGSIRLAFEQLKGRLEKEGLFDAAHKKPIPPMPGVIGVVTSATGAALQDICNVLARRYPLGQLVLAPVTVQGQEAAPGIAAAIQRLDAAGVADVIIVARGGGSAEDLWVFNDERIARAAYHCETPIISAIGHEIDFTILDFAADLRAPTPSAAAELAAPDIRSLQADLARCADDLRAELAWQLDQRRRALQQLRQAPALQGPSTLPVAGRDRLLQLQKQLTQLAAAKSEAAAVRLQSAARLAAGLNPYGVLARGYAMLQPAADTLQVGDAVTVHTAAAALDCTVNAITRKEIQQ